MSENNQDSQWNAGDGEAQRGPSFEDPTQPATPAPAAPEQGFQQTWGQGGAVQPEGGASRQGQPAGDPGWGGQPDPANPNGSAPQQHNPYGAQPDPYAAQQGSYATQQNPYGAQPDPYAQQGSYATQQNPYGAQPDPYAAQQNPYAAQQYPGQGLYGPTDPYQQPYGSYGGYGTYAYAGPAKSKVAAALLAFFLGGLGAHSFYLNKNNLGFIHLGLGIGSFILLIIVGIWSDSAPYSAQAGLGMLGLLAGLMSTANGIWAFVEFIMILVKPEHELGR
ncbi:TM2 domain-containing protein [Tessaracoccus antarcticus]|uniref:TM2 domain-containing protein n=1 Tax=Tessaracoccus antarcticus TaxID=2479848 RepID=UPI0013143636|nr:TM2 domain-containing protein [Tessaracoccus antarcticus]